ncbi:substrate-binding periplasmic protein [Chitinimonas sp.]|uniref:substrate-binding periplasmic protein n=1 Tax=Chitinimonas sp. TaxID=1934313 RepID=UPI0035B33076
MRTLAHIACLLLAGLCLAGQPADMPRRALTLISSDYPPYYGASLPDGGPVTKVVREALRRANLGLNMRWASWNRAVADTREGRADGLLGPWYSPDREAWLLYSEPIGENQLGFFVRKAAPLPSLPLTQLRAYSFGVVQGYANPEAFTAAQLHTIEAMSDELNLNALAVGRVHAALVDKGLADYLLRTSTMLINRNTPLVWQEPAIAKKTMHIGFSRAAKLPDSLIDKVNKVLKEMERDGSKAAILRDSGV